MRFPLLPIFILVAASSAPAACPPRGTENFDAMRAPLLPTGWVASQGVNVTGAPPWVTSNVASHSLPNAAFSTAPNNVLDNRLDTPAFLADSFGPGITFWSSYNLQSGRDGAVLEVSTPAINGGAFTDITDPAVGGSVDPPYNSLISSAFQSPIAGRMAWSGNSGGFVFTHVTYGNLTVPLPEIRFRFRLVSDNSGASEGWRIDAVTFLASECNPPTPPPTATASPAPTATATPIASPCGSPNVMADSTFEAGTPWSGWTVQTSTNFGTPLCNTAVCGTVGGSPYSGDNWVWFGGANVPETATLGQSVTIMAGSTPTLSFLMQKRNISGPTTDVLNVRVDGTIVQSYPEAGPFELAYSLRTIDLSAFADGGSHLILFEYIGPSTSLGSYLLDNITLTFGPTCPTPTPPPTVTPSATATPTPSPTATAPPTPSPTATAPPTPSPTPSPTPTPSLMPAQALNIATRVRVETGERVMIGGFIITGSGPKKVAIRGLGPSLTNAGLRDVLLDPTLELRGSGGALILLNDNWQDNPAQAAQLTALGLALADPREPGIVATLDPGAYTAIIAGKNQTSGIALVEIYDADPAADSRLANISTRGFVQSGDSVMIGGFILGSGGGSTSVAVRGLGPSLSQLGLSNVLTDPTLELRDGNGTLLIANDNWQEDPAAAAQLTAQGLAPQDLLESGTFATVPPGLFTAILAGKTGGVGLGLLEIYGNLHPRTLTVTTTSDSGPGSLRQALADANSGDTIRFDASLKGQAITLQSKLVIDQSVAISGPGADHMAVQGQPSTSFSIFHVLSGHTVIIEGLTIRGGNAIRLDEGAVGGGIRNDDGAILTVNNCVVGPNASFLSGGGIYNGFGARLTILNSVVRQNSIESPNPLGGGIYNAPGGTLEIRNSTISDNYLTGRVNPGLGAGIESNGTMKITNSTVRDNFGGTGAGIDNTGPLTISASTISGNTALSVVEPVVPGGGISHSGDSPLTIINSTISGNAASGRGGGISTQGPLTITNSTITGNDADENSGDIDNSGALQIANTILKAGSSGATIVNSTGTVTSLGFNLSSDNGGGFLTAAGDQINVDPLLGPLQNNGGPTFTHALLTGSPAINAGTPDSTPPPAYDQRGPGYPRVINGQIDIGSFEVQP